jgi:hypothetical protein
VNCAPHKVAPSRACLPVVATGDMLPVEPLFFDDECFDLFADLPVSEDGRGLGFRVSGLR